MVEEELGDEDMVKGVLMKDDGRERQKGKKKALGFILSPASLGGVGFFSRRHGEVDENEGGIKWWW